MAPALVVCLAISLYASEPGAPNPPGGQQLPAASQPQPPPPTANAQQAPVAVAPTTANAQQPPATGTPSATASSAPAAPRKQDIGRWWEKSSREYSPLLDQWLFHAEGTVSYMNAAGNASGSTFDTSDRMDIRKDRCTAHSVVQWSRQDMTYGFGEGAVNYTERTLREQVDCDVTKTLFFVVGIEDYQNTLWYMDKRLKAYVGGAATLFENEKHQLTFTGGLGHANFTFDRDRIMELPFPTNIDYNPSSGGALGIQTWRWKVCSRLTFNEIATYMKYFDSYLGYNWAMNLNADVPIDKRFAFRLTYRVQDQANRIVTALHVFEQDRAFLLGVKVSM
jgi:hypothetical protein